MADLYTRTMNELQEVYAKNETELSALKRRNKGIRSSQIGAIIKLLIEKGIIKD